MPDWLQHIVRRLFFWWRYVNNQTPWDTGITPPEIVSLIEDEQINAGRAIDLGCGTGTNAIYLAEHGWQVVGIDFVPGPSQEARQKARQARVADRTRFIVGDVTRLPELDPGGPFDLALDIGCGHSLPEDKLGQYTSALAGCIRPGGIFMLYMFRPTPERPRGLEPADVEALFAPHFELVWTDLGHDKSADTGSAWYRFERKETL